MTPSPPAAANVDQAGQARLRARYIKDLSFENPGAPDSFGIADPTIDIAVRVDGRQRASLHEVVITLTATARHDSMILWLAEICYAGLFEIPDIPEPARQRFMLTEAPSLLFPWIDRIIADVARDGGLPALNLSPPDFDALYRQQQARTNVKDPRSAEPGAERDER